MPPDTIAIDVVIVSWKARAMTMRCLEHLGRQTVPHQLIVVDNASGDGTAEAIRERWPEALVIVNEDNVGFGRAVNQGAAAGTGDAIVLVNNDLFVEPDFLEQLVAPLAADRAVGQVAGLTLLPGEGPPRIDSAGVLLDRTLAGVNFLRHEPAEAATGREPSVPSGGAVAYRRAAFDAVGGFDHHLFAYGEDVDLGLRIAAAGWTCRLASEARGVHLGGASMGKASPFQRRHSGTARGFLLGRYRLGATAMLRAAITELLVVSVDFARHRTLDSLRGRIAGWRLARSCGPRLTLPGDTVDTTLGPIESLRLRNVQ